MQIRTHAQKFFKRIGGYIPGNDPALTMKALHNGSVLEVHGMSYSEEDIQKKIAKLVCIIELSNS